MSYKVYKSQNYFVVHDTSTSEDVIRQVRNLVRWEKLNSIYSFYWNTPNLSTSGNSIVRLGYYDFSDLVDSTGTAWSSESALDLYLEQWTGHICCPLTGDDALYDLQNTEGTSLETGAIASGGSAIIVAPDASINIKKTGDGTIATVTIPSGTSTNYNVADNAITVNGSNGFTIDATDPLDIVLKDGTGTTVTPTSVTPNAGSHHVDIVLPTATKSIYWELNFNGTDDVIYIPATTNNVGTLTSGSGSNVGTITVSTDGVTYGTLSFPFTPTATNTYYFKRSTATVSGAYTMVGTYV